MIEPALLPSAGALGHWSQLLDAYQASIVSLECQRPWIFRGLGYELSWNGGPKVLRTSLERAMDDFDIPYNDRRKWERSLIHQFRRHAYLYHVSLPDEDDDIAWLALMQHHGAPTRLLDWTYSFFVAAYFAVAEAENKVFGGCHENCTVLGIDVTWLRERFQAIWPGPPEFKKRLDEDPYMRGRGTHDLVFSDLNAARGVYSCNPFHLPPRERIQQGCFLIPLDVSWTFVRNLEAMIEGQPDYRNHFKEFRIAGDARPEILKQLYRMNMTAETLFPGLDGYSRSLRTLLSTPLDWHGEWAGKWLKPPPYKAPEG